MTDITIKSKQTAPTSDQSVTMSLRRKASSKLAQLAINAIAHKLSGNRKPLRNHLRIISAIAGDLLKGASFEPLRPCYRPMTAKDFTGLHIGYDAFSTVLRNLRTAKYVEVITGERGSSEQPGRVTRILPMPRLFGDLAMFDITPANYGDHFENDANLPLVHDPVRLRASSSRNFAYDKIPGKPMAVDRINPTVIHFAAEVVAINEYLGKQSYEGMTFEGLYRGFNQGDCPEFDWNKGGRLYVPGGGYQSIPREERSSIRINGEPVVEVDISASHLTILHALTKTPLPAGPDPYAVPGIDRDAIKRFVTMTIGSGKIPGRWSPETAEDYQESFDRNPISGRTGNLFKDFPIKAVRDATLSHIPLLGSMESLPHSWASLQFRESEILIGTIKALLERDIPSLPLHDSLICKDSDKEVVSSHLIYEFHSKTGYKCITKYK